MISSIHNPKIKLLRELLSKPRSRDENQMIVCEGVRLLEEALVSGQHFVFVLAAQEVLSLRGKALLEKLISLAVPVEFVNADLLQRLGETETSQGILAVLKRPIHSLPKSASMVLIPSEISDPGNMGTMLRTAVAAGVDWVVIPPSTVDVYSPKVMRSAMGAHFRLPIHFAQWEVIKDWLKNFSCFLAESTANLAYDQVDYRQPFALIIGNEARGAGEEAQKIATHRIAIPMAKHCESLNAAVAAGIILFEAVRQRRIGK